jgi:Protein of unknown function (DUF2889)
MTPGQVLHTRTYDIESQFEDSEHFRLVGHLRDVHPDGMWGINDTEPMTIHHMELHVVVQATTLQITEVFTKMHVHPQEQCPIIESAYQQLVGLSIARGFTHKVREMFGGPRACTHIGALVLAMAPVAIQSLWPFMREQMPVDEVSINRSPETNRREFERSRDTCHVWASDGPMFELIEHGEPVPLPLWGQQRLRERGIDLSTFTGPV